MYYQNGNYMQDLNYYNQNPNYGFNPYSQNNFPVQNMNTQMNGQQNMMQMSQTQNLSAMYPAVYRIISPVVSQVLSNKNIGYLTEDNLNNMVDTVYDIVEGDINLNNNNSNTSNTSNTNSNASNCERNSSTSRQNTTSISTAGADTQNALLRDLIKIMILNEIHFRKQNNSNQMMMQNNIPNANMTQSMFM